MKFKDIIHYLLGNVSIYDCRNNKPQLVDEDEAKYLKSGSIYDDYDLVSIFAEEDNTIVYLIGVDEK